MVGVNYHGGLASLAASAAEYWLMITRITAYMLGAWAFVKELMIHKWKV